MTLGLEGAPVWGSWALFGLGLVVGLIVRGWVMRGVPPEIVNPRASGSRRL